MAKWHHFKQLANRLLCNTIINSGFRLEPLNLLTTISHAAARVTCLPFPHSHVAASVISLRDELIRNTAAVESAIC